RYEKEILMMYVSDHPLAPYEGAIARMTKFNLGELEEREAEIPSVTLVGMISGIVESITKKGKKMAKFTLEDTTGSIECVCFKYAENQDAVKEDAIVKVKAKFDPSDRGKQLVVFEVEPIELDEADAGPSRLEVRVASSEFNQLSSARFDRILKGYPGKDGVVLFVEQSDGRKFRAELPLTVDSRSNALLSELYDLFGSKVFTS
ncbi:MAG: OB-fold nucleic acid binding domain-containing protein, partial [Eggerthellaceae bacterium]|nr:OB-fold nucleic acid binding domain-containing protein [Eggerthellaceae bacterium]